MRSLHLADLSLRVRYREDALPALKKEGVDVLVAGFGPAASSVPVLLERGCHVHMLGNRQGPIEAARLVGYLRRVRADVVHCHETLPAVIGGAATTIARVPVSLYHRHQSANRRSIAEKASALAGRLNAGTIVAAEAVIDYARRIDGTPTEKICVVHDGVPEMRSVDEDEVNGLRKRLGLLSDERVIVAVARFRAEKGLDTLLRAFARIGDSRCHLVLVGDGPEEAFLRSLAASIAPARIHFVGDQDDVAPWFALADIVTQPSYTDAFPLTIVEAMSAARPVVASAVDGMPEAVDDGVTGLLVPQRDPQRLAQALATLVDSPDVADKMGSAGYERYRELFTVEGMVRGWMACYSRFLAENRN